MWRGSLSEIGRAFIREGQFFTLDSCLHNARLILTLVPRPCDELPGDPAQVINCQNTRRFHKRDRALEVDAEKSSA
jgi:hypothetical protein